MINLQSRGTHENMIYFIFPNILFSRIFYFPNKILLLPFFIFFFIFKSQIQKEFALFFYFQRDLFKTPKKERKGTHNPISCGRRCEANMDLETLSFLGFESL